MATATLDDHIEGLKSPMLVAVTELKLRHISESPPLASRDSSAVPSEDEDDKDDDESERGDLGDANLMRALAPNDPLPAWNALKRRLPTERSVRSSMSIDQRPANTGGSVDNNVAQRTLPAKQDVDGDFMACYFPRKESFEGPLVQSSRRLSLSDRGLLSPNAEKRAHYDTRPPPLQRPSFPIPPDSEDDSLAKSPLLAQFTIDRRHADPDTVLAALHTTSPPRSSPGSIDVRQTLPSLTTALGDAGSPFSAASPHLSRSASSFGPPISAIPSAMSPPSISSNPHLWKSSRERTHSTSTPSDQAVSTPHSAWASQSPATTLTTPLSTTSSNGPPHINPAAYPAPSPHGISTNGALLSPTHHSHPDPNADPSLSSSAAVAAAVNGIFRCTVPGCTAAPFQTQYLLNSHANVHSDTRPHFCPVSGCPRGPGGQGFKRKNEMIR